VKATDYIFYKKNQVMELKSAPIEKMNTYHRVISQQKSSFDGKGEK
jgi:hypothetical protein